MGQSERAAMLGFFLGLLLFAVGVVVLIGLPDGPGAKWFDYSDASRRINDNLFTIKAVVELVIYFGVSLRVGLWAGRRLIGPSRQG